MDLTKTQILRQESLVLIKFGEDVTKWLTAERAPGGILEGGSGPFLSVIKMFFGSTPVIAQAHF